MEPSTDPTRNRLHVLQTPFCGDLRSKKYYLRDSIPTCEDDYYDSTGHTWCYHTQMPVGPDGVRASPEECGPGRICYRSALSQPAPAEPNNMLATDVLKAYRSERKV